MRALLALSLLFALPLEAQRSVTRDRDGRRTGTIEKRGSRPAIVRDNNGRRLGTIETRRGGVTIVRDQHGRIVGTVRPR